jgi:superfamily I DNA/RNA helicase
MRDSQKIARTDTVAILYRSISQSQLFEEACVANSCPYAIYRSAGGFYKRSEIKECLCFFCWLNNGDDDGSMLRARKTPSKGIGAKAVQEFQSYFYLVQSYIRENAPQEYHLPTMLNVLISTTISHCKTTKRRFLCHQAMLRKLSIIFPPALSRSSCPSRRK